MKSTPEKILSNATTLFAEKGYYAISLSQIAQKSNVTQSLILYHFKNKQMLWKEVKNYLSNKYTFKPKNYQTFQSFVHDIVKQQIDLYKSDERIKKIIIWSIIEQNDSLFVSKLTSFQWIPFLQKLQNKGALKKTYTPETIILLITAMIQAFTLDLFDVYTAKKINQETYKKLIYDSLKHLES